MTPAEFKLQFPEFSSETDARVQLYIDQSAPFFDQDRWGEFYQLGVSNFVAHNLALANYQAKKQNAHTSDTVSKKVGDVQIGKDSALLNLQAKDPFMRTTYGQQYRYYQRLAGSGALAL